jgi:hypothetical protein
MQKPNVTALDSYLNSSVLTKKTGSIIFKFSMKKIFRLFLASLVIFAVSCGGTPDPQTYVTTESTPAQKPPAAQSSAPEKFDPSSISQEEFETAKTEAQQLVQRLNGLIRSRNYNAWVSYLSPDYFAEISSPAYLARASQQPRLIQRNISLTTAREYFDIVVVPSRTRDRVDDIEFISHNKIKALTLSPKGEWLRLYELEKTKEGWKIIKPSVKGERDEVYDA